MAQFNNGIPVHLVDETYKTVTGLGGSSAGGGNNTYSNASGDFVATANNATKTITLSAYASTILSSTIGVRNFVNGSVKRITTGGAIDTLPLTNISFTSNVLTITDMTGTFAATDTVVVTVIGPDKGFAEDIDATKTTLHTAVSSNSDSIAAVLSSDAIKDGLTTLTPKYAAISVVAGGAADSTLVAAVTGKKLRVLSLNVVVSAAVTLRFEAGTGGTALSGQMSIAANQGLVLPFSPVGWIETTAGALLNLEVSAAATIAGTLTYVEV